MKPEHQIRLNEIIFCKLFQQLLKDNTNPIKVYDLIEAVANLVGANVTILNSVLTIILSNDRRYLPTKKEFAYLLRLSNMPVRNVCKLAGISQTTYYAMSENDMHIEPKFTPIQYEQILKIMRAFKSFAISLEGSIL